MVDGVDAILMADVSVDMASGVGNSESLSAMLEDGRNARCGPIFLSIDCEDSHRPQKLAFPSDTPGIPAIKFSLAVLVVLDQVAHAQSEVLSQPVTKIRSESERPRPSEGWLANVNHD